MTDKWHVNAKFVTQTAETCVRKVQALITKVGGSYKEEILEVARDMYLLAIEDCKSTPRQQSILPVAMWGLKDVYDTLEPNHNLAFY